MVLDDREEVLDFYRRSGELDDCKTLVNTGGVHPFFNTVETT